jgi:microcystin-dependent protein
MSDPFVAEMRIFPFNFPPKGWAFCDGQLLPLSQNTALFSLLGTYYGGDGKSTFALPDMQGNVPIQPGTSTTGTTYDLGQMSGSQYVTLLQSEMPIHNHDLKVSYQDGNNRLPGGKVAASGVGIGFYGPTPGNVQLNFSALPIAGGSLPHNNMMNYLTLNFCIALQGIYPPRT